jgi:hypothetical protein
MKQGRHVLIAILWIQAFAASGQNVEFLKGPFSTGHKIGLNAPFHFVEEKFDTAELDYVGQMRVDGFTSLRSMYHVLEKHAKKNGANGFRLANFDRAAATLVADLYFLSEHAVVRNNMLKAHNTVYIFGGDLYGPTTHDAFEFNGSVRNIRNGTYFKYTLAEGEKAKLMQGTITGTVMWISWKPNQLPSYYSVRDFGEKAVVKRTTVSRSGRPGKFVEVESGLGALLGVVLEETGRE